MTYDELTCYAGFYRLRVYVLFKGSPTVQCDSDDPAVSNSLYRVRPVRTHTFPDVASYTGSHCK